MWIYVGPNAYGQIQSQRQPCPPGASYLKALEAFDRSFPGFTHDAHGIEAEAGVYRMLVLK
ncbi:hypothetical protein [Pseudomonas putida]|uniref:Orn/Lys/Arg family decarboxylase n=1 Tax=Pseudomonas putida TaxID=303 RepID=UPI003CC7F098